MLVNVCPKKYRRILTLWVLSLSPHYFFRDIDKSYRNIGIKEFLEREYDRNLKSRTEIFNGILSNYLNKSAVVVDYGCGPGFLSKHVSFAVKQIFAVDISQGALECAKIINSAPNLIYINVNEIDQKISDNTVDLVFSFAVIQHVNEVIFEEILKICSKKLKKSGVILLHMPLEIPTWISEEEQKKDKSLFARLKLKYALNCFGRTKEQVTSLLNKNGFENIQINDIMNMRRQGNDDVFNQQLVIAQKTP